MERGLTTGERDLAGSLSRVLEAARMSSREGETSGEPCCPQKTHRLSHAERIRTVARAVTSAHGVERGSLAHREELGGGLRALRLRRASSFASAIAPMPHCSS